MRTIYLLFSYLLVSPVALSLAQDCIHTGDSAQIAQPKLDTARQGDQFVLGKIEPSDTPASVTLCLKQDERITTLGPRMAGQHGEFSFKLDSPLKGTETFQVQTSIRKGDVTAYGIATDPIKVKLSCAFEVTDVLHVESTISLKIKRGDDDGKVSGNIKKFKSGDRVQVCINDEPLSSSDAAVLEGGTYTIVNAVPLKSGDVVKVMLMREGKPVKLSDAYTVEPDDEAEHRGARYIFVAGYESFWFNAQNQESNPFVNLFLEGPEVSLGPLRFFAPWGRVRLLGAPQVSTNSVGSLFTDPSGKITAQDFSRVGTALDWQIGLEKFLTPPGPNWGRLSGIVSLGATNPLSVTEAPVYLKTPPQNSLECGELIKRFSVENGYPLLTPGDTTTPSCLKSGTTQVTDIAFINQDRTNAFWKWQAGMRIEGSIKCGQSYEKCSDSFGTLDLTVGQDAAMTRGQVRNFVFKTDGIFPIPTGDTSYLYLYGSAYLRLKQNVNYQPLYLAPDAMAPAIPSLAVAVLPFKQPDRDFFRLGIGINLGQVFCKFSIGQCADGGAK